MMDLRSQLVYYGRWSDSDIPELQRFDLIVLQYSHYDGLSELRAIQKIRESGTLVLLYISLGEDVTTFNGQQPRVGDGRGPAFYDPITERVIFEHTGIAGFYLDHWNERGFLSGDNANRYPDGQPDRHGDWGACYVNAGDPDWQAIVLEEAMTLARIGIDGFFLDTPETPDPWQGYGWTAQGMHDLIQRIDETFPGHILLLNRGTFFFDPNNPFQYAWNPLEHIDIALFESYFLDSNYPIDPESGIDHHVSPFYPLNRMYTSPKVNVAAGYKNHPIPVIQIDYARDPNTFPMREPEIYRQLIEESVREQGRLGLLIDRELSRISTVLLDHPPREDSEPPSWQNSSIGKKSLYPERNTPFDVVGADYLPRELMPGDGRTQIPPSFSPRAGVQKAIPHDGAVTLLWDVAVDQTRPVAYNIYYTTDIPFDLARAIVLPDVEYSPSQDYLERSFLTTDDACPYEYTVEGLENGVVYYFCIRAEDATSAVEEELPSAQAHRGPRGGLEDENLRILPAVPSPSSQVITPDQVRDIRQTYPPLTIDGSLDDWGDAPEILASRVVSESATPNSSQLRALRIYDTLDDLYIGIQTTGQFDIWDLVIYLDTDDTAYVGHPQYGGADLMFKQGSLFTFTWDWHAIPGSGEVYSFSDDTFELRLPKKLFGLTSYRDIRVVVGSLSSGAVFPSGGAPGLTYRQKNVLQDVEGPLFLRGEGASEGDTDSSSLPRVQIEDLGVGESLRLSWDPAADVNGPVTYDVLCADTGKPFLGSDNEPVLRTEEHSVVITGLAEGVSRTFVVQALDRVGNVTELPPVKGVPTTFEIPPSWLDSPDPGILHVHAGDGSVRFYFNRATDRFGYPVTYHLAIARRVRGEVQTPEIEKVIRPIPSDTPEYDYYYEINDLKNTQEYAFTLSAQTYDGVYDQAPRTIFATPLSPNRITQETMDGRFGDWASDPTVIYVGRDIVGDQPEGLGYFDIDEVWQSIKDQTLFLRFTVKDPIERPDWQMSLYFDLDGSIDTGFKGIIGTDLMILGSGQAYRLNTGTVWDPVPVGHIALVRGYDQPNSVELAIPFSLAGNVEQQARMLLRFGNWIDATNYDEFGPISLRQGTTDTDEDPEDSAIPLFAIILLASLLIVPMIVIFIRTSSYM